MLRSNYVVTQQTRPVKPNLVGSFRDNYASGGGERSSG
jgi:hypothetical protein